MKSNKKYLVTFTFLILMFLVYTFVEPINNLVNESIFVLKSLSIEQLKEYILSFGILSPIVSFLLMIFQSVIAPLPAFLITFTNATLFGWINGAIISWSSAMCGASLCFFISRFLGREFVEKLTKSSLKQVDEFFVKYGKNAILIARLLPFVSFDLISYGAGLTSIKFSSFFVATGIGQLPATLVYSYFGEFLSEKAKTLFMLILVLISIGVLIYTINKFKKESVGEKN